MADLKLLISSLIIIYLVTLPKCIVSHLDKTTAEVARSQGFVAIEHHIRISEKNVLNLVQILNPLINHPTVGKAENKQPILMVGGTLSKGTWFMSNYENVRPKDYSKFNAGCMTLKELIELLKDDPSSKSLAFLALNFGHQVWILNRRGNPESMSLSSRSMNEEQKVEFDYHKIFGDIFKLKELFPKKHLEQDYWNYSLDEQALTDLPVVIDFIRIKTSSSRIAFAGHSSGCNLMLMALSTDIELANKVSKSVLWAPALYPVSPVSSVANLLGGPSAYIGPVDMRPLTNLIVPMCTFGLYFPLCTAITTFLFGPGGDQQKFKPEYFKSILNVVSSHEIGQLGQAAVGGELRAYDYMDPFKNKELYGQMIPPLYNLSRIISDSVSLWVGETDVLSPLFSVEKMVANFKVPVETHFFKLPELYFHHESFLSHIEVANLAVIPSLKTIETVCKKEVKSISDKIVKSSSIAELAVIKETTSFNSKVTAENIVDYKSNSSEPSKQLTKESSIPYQSLKSKL